jgi:hypothetical protein
MRAVKFAKRRAVAAVVVDRARRRKCRVLLPAADPSRPPTRRWRSECSRVALCCFSEQWRVRRLPGAAWIWRSCTPRQSMRARESRRCLPCSRLTCAPGQNLATAGGSESAAKRRVKAHRARRESRKATTAIGDRRHARVRGTGSRPAHASRNAGPRSHRGDSLTQFSAPQNGQGSAVIGQLRR